MNSDCAACTTLYDLLQVAPQVPISRAEYGWPQRWNLHVRISWCVQPNCPTGSTLGERGSHSKESSEFRASRYISSDDTRGARVVRQTASAFTAAARACSPQASKISAGRLCRRRCKDSPAEEHFPERVVNSCTFGAKVRYGSDSRCPRSGSGYFRLRVWNSRQNGGPT